MDPINQPTGTEPGTSPEPQPTTPPAETPTPSVAPAATPDATPPVDPAPPIQPMPIAPLPTTATAPAKSNTGLIIGIVVGAIVLLGIIGVIVLSLFASKLNQRNDIAPPIAPAGSSSTPSSPSKNSAEVASSTSDFEAVCNGGSISNAVAFTDKKSAVITSFYQNPRYSDTWSYTSVGFDKSYYVKSSEYAKISTVACLEEVKGSRTVGQTCDYQDDGKTVSIKYHSLQYKLTYYEAKTGKKIADGGTINAPATKCPSFISYDKETLSAFASVDDDALEAAHDAFIAQ